MPDPTNNKKKDDLMISISRSDMWDKINDHQNPEDTKNGLQEMDEKLRKLDKKQERLDSNDMAIEEANREREELEDIGRQAKQDKEIAQALDRQERELETEQKYESLNETSKGVLEKMYSESNYTNKKDFLLSSPAQDYMDTLAKKNRIINNDEDNKDYKKSEYDLRKSVAENLSGNPLNGPEVLYDQAKHLFNGAVKYFSKTGNTEKEEQEYLDLVKKAKQYEKPFINKLKKKFQGRIDDLKKKAGSIEENSPEEPFSYSMANTAMPQGTREVTAMSELSNLNLAISKYEKSIESMDKYLEAEDSTLPDEMWNGITEVNWNVAEEAAQTVQSLLLVTQDPDKLTDAQKDYAQALSDQQLFDKNVKGRLTEDRYLARISEGAGESAKMMLELAATSGYGSTGAKLGEKFAQKLISKRALKFASSLEGNLARKLMFNVEKAGINVMKGTGDIAGRALVSPSSYGNMVKNYTGQVRRFQDTINGEKYVMEVAATKEDKLSALKKIQRDITIAEGDLEELQQSNQAIEPGSTGELDNVDQKIKNRREDIRKLKKMAFDLQEVYINEEGEQDTRVPEDKSIIGSALEGYGETVRTGAVELYGGKVLGKLAGKALKYGNRAVPGKARNFYRMMEDTGLGKKIKKFGVLSEKTAKKTGSARVLGSYREEWGEEMVDQLTPGFNEDYSQKLEQATKLQTHLDILGTIAMIKGAPSTIKEGARAYDYLKTGNTGKTMDQKREEVTKRQVVKMIQELDQAMTDEEIADEAVMRAGGSLYSIKDYKEKKAKLVKEGKNKRANTLERRSFLNMAEMAMRTGTFDEFKNSIRSVQYKKDVSESTKKNAASVESYIGKLENLQQEYGQRKNFGEILNKSFEVFNNEQTLQEFDEEISELKERTREEVEELKNDKTISEDFDVDLVSELYGESTEEANKQGEDIAKISKGKETSDDLNTLIDLSVLKKVNQNYGKDLKKSYRKSTKKSSEKEFEDRLKQEKEQGEKTKNQKDQQEDQENRTNTKPDKKPVSKKEAVDTAPFESDFEDDFGEDPEMEIDPEKTMALPDSPGDKQKKDNKKPKKENKSSGVPSSNKKPSSGKTVGEQAVMNFQPVAYEEENENHKKRVNSFAEKIGKIGMSADFQDFIGSLINNPNIGILKTERNFNLLAKAWEKARETQFTQDEVDAVYSELFVDTSHFDPSDFESGEKAEPESNKEVTEKNTKTEKKEKKTKVDPITKISRTIYNGVKTVQSKVKAAYLGLDYTINEDGDYETTTNTLNTGAQVMVHWDNFRPENGDKVELGFNFNYLKDPDNPIRIWSDPDGSPKPIDTTVREVVDNILGEGSYDSLPLDSEEDMVELLKNNEDLLKIMPTTINLNGNPTEAGINTYNWWNPQNVGLQEDPITKEKLYGERARTVQQARTKNMDMRRRLLEGKVDLEVESKTPGVENKLILRTEKEKENGHSNDFNSIEIAFNGNKDAAKQYTGVAIFKGESLQSHRKDGMSSLKVNGKPVGMDDIVNYQEFMNSLDEDETANGKVVMLKQMGYEMEKGVKVPKYSIHRVVTNHPRTQQKLENTSNILMNIGKLRKAKRTDPESKSAREFDKMNSYIKDNFGIDLETQFNLFGDFYENRERQYKDRVDYYPDLASSPLEENLPNLQDYNSFEEFKEDVENQSVGKTTYRDIVNSNIHTPYVFSKIEAPGKKPIWTTQVQPTIRFKDKIEIDGQPTEDPRKELSQARLKLDNLNSSDKTGESKREKRLREKKKKNLEKKIGELEERANSQKEEPTPQEGEGTEGSGTARPVEDEDIQDINMEILFRAMRSVDLSKDFNKASFMEVLIDTFDSFVEEVKERGNQEEIDYLEDNKFIILGVPDEFGRENYENSARKLLDAMLGLDVEEEFDFSGIYEKSFDKASYEESATTRLSDKVKMVLAGVRDTSVEAEGFGGIPQYMSFFDTVDAVQQLLADADNNTLSSFAERVNDKYEKNPKEFGFYKEILERLQELESTNKDLLNQILTSLYQPRVEMNFAMINQMDDGSFTIKRYNADSKNPDILTKKKWDNLQRSSNLYIPAEEGLFTINEEEAKKVEKLYKKISSEKEDPDISDLDRYFKFFGIHLSKETLQAMKDNELGNPELSLYKHQMIESEGRQVKGSEVYGILSENQIFDLLHSNMLKGIENQRFGKLLSKYGTPLDAKVGQVLSKDDYEEYRSFGKTKKGVDKKKGFLNDLYNNGKLKNQGVDLAFGEQYVEDPESQFSLNLLTDNNSKALKRLIKAHNEMTFTSMSTMRIAGKPVNSYQKPKRITTILKKLQRDKKFRKRLGETDINSESLTLEILEKHPDIQEYSDVILASLEALKLRGTKSRNDMGMPEMSPKDQFVSLFNMFAHNDGAVKDSELSEKGMKLRKGTIAFPALSDSSQIPMLKGVLIDLGKDNFTGDNLEEFSDQMKEFLFQRIIKGDLKRIAGHTRVKKEKLFSAIDNLGLEDRRGNELSEAFLSIGDYKGFIEKYGGYFTQGQLNQLQKLNSDVSLNIKGYNTGAGQITSMPSMNMKLVDVKDKKGDTVQRTLNDVFKHYSGKNGAYVDNIEDFYRDYKSEIDGEIQDNLDHEADQFYSADGKNGLMVENGIVNKGFKHLDRKYLKDKGEMKQDKKARLIAYDYAVNNMLQLKEVQNLFAGDIANYFKDKMGKNREFEMPTVDVGEILDHYYPDMRPGTKRKILDNIYNQENFLGAAKIYPEIMAGKSVPDMGKNNMPLNDRIKTIHPIAETKNVQMYRDVQNNLSKRLKELISPGDKPPNEGGGKKYYQIFLQDNDTASESLLSTLQLFYPEKYDDLKDKVREFKNLDDIYETERSDAQSERHSSLLESFSGEIPKIVDYFKTASTDAQEYATWRDNLNQLYNEGKVNEEEFRAIFDKLGAQEEDLDKNGVISDQNRWKESERSLKDKAIMQPTKPLYSGMHIENHMGHKMTRDVYIKSSSFPLLPELTESFPKLDNMRKNLQKMESEGKTVRASYDSANKVGSSYRQLPVSELYKKDADMQMLSDASLELDRENFYIQQDKPYDPQKTHVNRATQFEKIILGDGINKIKDKIFPSTFDKKLLDEIGIKEKNRKVSGKDLGKIYKKIYQKEQKLFKDRLFRKYNINSYSDIAKGKPSAMEKLSSFLKRRSDNEQDREALGLLYTVRDETGAESVLTKYELDNQELEPVRADFRIPLYMMPNSNKMESILNSQINKNNINLKAPGFSSPVASQEGFDFKGDIGDHSPEALFKKGLITTENFDPEKGLQATRMENGQIKRAQVFIANKYKVRNEETGQMEAIDLKKFVKDGKIDTDKLPKDLLDMFSFRIPTSSHQSGAIIEVAGFLPETMGDLMIVPKDHTIQIGEDYDIDTRYVYNYNYLQNSDGSLKRLEYSDLPPENTDDYHEKAEKGYRDKKEKVYREFYEERIVNRDGEISVQRRRINKLWKQNRDRLFEIALIENLLEDRERNADKIMSAVFSEEFDKETVTDQDLRDRVNELKSYMVPEDRINEWKEESGKTYRKIMRGLKQKLKDDKSIIRSWERYNNSVKAQKDEIKILENNMVGLYKSIYTSESPEVQRMISKVLSTENAENTANAMQKKLDKNNRSRIYNFYSAKTQMDIIKAGAYGKIGIGEHSNAVTMNSLFQQSEFEHRIIKEYIEHPNGLLEKVPYNIRLGSIVFEGKLGKIENEGSSISALGMESQNSSTDNQKLGIMDKRNETPETMGVLKILQAMGLDNEGKVHGKKMSYSSLFLNQPILRRYTELSAKYNSLTTLAYGDKEDLIKKQLLSEFGKGLDKLWAENMEAKKLVGILNNEAKERAGKGLTSQKLWDNLTEEDAENLSQWYVYESFLSLKKASKSYNDLQKLINIENGGMGVSYFNVIDLNNKLWGLMGDITPEITNSKEMIGEPVFVPLDLEDFEKTEEDLVKDGYVRVSDKRERTMFIKPSTHYGEKIVNSVSMGYNMYNSLFPYDNKNTKEQIDNVLAASGVRPGSSEELELKYKIVSELKNYSYTKNDGLFGQNLGQTVDELFFGEDSLAGYLSKLSETEGYRGMFDKAFFKDLEFNVRGEGYPSIIKFNNSDSSKLNRLYIYNALKKLAESNRELPPKNGRPYSEEELAKDLLKYSLLSDQANGAIGFREDLPMKLLNRYGVSENIRSISRRGNELYQSLIYNGGYKALESLLGTKIDEDGVIHNNNDVEIPTVRVAQQAINKKIKRQYNIDGATTLNRDGSITVNVHTGDNFNSSFTRQFFQNNPDQVREIGKFYQSEGPVGKEVKPSKKLGGILKENGVPHGQLDGISGLYIMGQPDYISFRGLKDELYLFEKTGEDYYERITPLGVFGFNEYKAASKINKSKVNKNNYTKTRARRPFTNFSNKKLEETDLSTVLANLIKDKQGPYSQVVKLFRPFVDPDGVSVETTSEIDNRGAAAYDRENSKIYISKKFLDSDPSLDRVKAAITEEFLHHVTHSTIGEYLEFTGVNNDGELKMKIKLDENGEKMKLPNELQTLLTVYRKAFKQMAKKHGKENLIDTIKSLKGEGNLDYNDQDAQTDAYRVTNLHEFIAGLFMKHEEFAQEMANTKYLNTDKSILEKFSEVLSKFFNRILPNKRKDTVSAEAVRSLYAFLEGHKENGPKRRVPKPPKNPLPEGKAMEEAKKHIENSRPEENGSNEGLSYQPLPSDAIDLTSKEEVEAYLGKRFKDEIGKTGSFTNGSATLKKGFSNTNRKKVKEINDKFGYKVLSEVKPDSNDLPGRIQMNLQDGTAQKYIDYYNGAEGFTVNNINRFVDTTKRCK